jgi:L-rhamnose mutarotase
VIQRSAFVLRVRPDKIDEYVAAHREVWPDMLRALKESGIRNYSIFRDGNQVFGYFESDDLAAAADYLGRQEVRALAGRDGGPARGASARLRAAAARGDLPARLKSRP